MNGIPGINVTCLHDQLYYPIRGGKPLICGKIKVNPNKNNIISLMAIMHTM